MIVTAVACLAGGDARSAGPKEKEKSRGAARGPTAAEFAALKQRVDEQHELLMRMTQLEGEHYEFLLRLLHSTGRSATGTAARGGSSASAGAAGAGNARPLPASEERHSRHHPSAHQAGDDHRARRGQGEAVGADLRLCR